jgi:hypothetical protein
LNKPQAQSGFNSNIKQVYLRTYSINIMSFVIKSAIQQGVVRLPTPAGSVMRRAATLGMRNGPLDLGGRSTFQRGPSPLWVPALGTSTSSFASAAKRKGPQTKEMKDISEATENVRLMYENTLREHNQRIPRMPSKTLFVGRIAKPTKQKKLWRFRALVCAGTRFGVLGLGIGKGVSVS